ncbi:MAG TPA: hypothetical protein VNY05_37655 [Candidatus Acidoferrales bacterium]|nr:hypothetical protein [Candidatus Acidoferrales bacterium]
MIRRVHIIGVLALGLMVTAAATAPAYCRLVSSAQSFQHYFRDLNKAGNSLSPIERLVFSLVMANSKPAPAHRS